MDELLWIPGEFGCQIPSALLCLSGKRDRMLYYGSKRDWGWRWLCEYDGSSYFGEWETTANSCNLFEWTLDTMYHFYWFIENVILILEWIEIESVIIGYSHCVTSNSNEASSTEFRMPRTLLFMFFVFLIVAQFENQTDCCINAPIESYGMRHYIVYCSPSFPGDGALTIWTVLRMSLCWDQWWTLGLCSLTHWL